MTVVRTPDWGVEYDKRLRRHEALLEEVLFILREGTVDAAIKTHSVTGRVKTRESFVEKVSRKSYGDPFHQMADVVGARVVLLFLGDLPKVHDVVREQFAVLHEENKIDAAPAESFGYMSVHYECTLRPEHSGPRYDKLKGLRFEIQCRTLLMDAWANVSHYLAYKGEASIPEALRRDFHALSGMFYVADKHFELLTNASRDAEVAAATVIEQGASGGQEPIDRATVRGLLRRLYIDREAAPAEAVSDFVEEVTTLGYENLGELAEKLEAAHDLALEYEKDHPPYPGPVFVDVGLARQALAIADERYARKIYMPETGAFADLRRRLTRG